MSRRSVSILASVGAVLLLGGALTACATPTGSSGPAPSPIPSVADDTAPVDDAEPGEVDAAWLDNGSMIAVLTHGSSGCVPEAAEVSYAAGVLEVALAPLPADTMCTRDYVLRGVPVVLPEGVDPAQDLVVRVTGDEVTGETELEGVPGLTPGDGVMSSLPSAGWADEDDTFALLTWGSSSCKPQVVDAAATAAGEVTVTFADPDPAQICTADMAPRVTVVTVPDVDGDTAYEAVLNGDGYDGVRVPIVGER